LWPDLLASSEGFRTDFYAPSDLQMYLSVVSLRFSNNQTTIRRMVARPLKDRP